MSQRSEEARKYNQIRVRLRLTNISFTVLYLLLFQLFISGNLKNLAVSLTPNFYYAFTGYLAAFSFLHYLFNFPLHFYSSFVLERRFNLSDQRFSSWFTDDIKSGLISLFIFLVFMQALYIFLRNFDRTWWIWIAIFWFVATIILAKVTPVIIIPIFFKYSPVGEKLKKDVIELSKKCGIKVLNVFKIDFSKKTKKLNAALTGMGKSRRVILADNLIRDFSEEEIEGVLAHEFAHHKLFHIWKLIIFGAASIFVSFYILYLVSSRLALLLGAQNIYDMRIFPAFMLILFITGFALLPLQNGFSRRLEREADLFALEVTVNKRAFISLMNKLALKNLADTNPPKWVKFMFYDHPPISERIRLAEKE